MWAALRGTNLSDARPVLALLTLTPFAAAAAVGAAGAAAMLRCRPAAVTGAVAAAALFTAVLPRVVPDRGPPLSGPTTTIMSVNLDGTHADPRAVVALVDRYDVDVLGVVESRSSTRRLAAAGLGELLPHGSVWPFAGGGSALFSRAPLAGGDADSRSYTPLRRTINLSPGRQLQVMVLHPPHPTTAGYALRWHQDLDRIPAPKDNEAPFAVVGDFNATLDHAELRAAIDRGYRDAADATGRGLSMTWPTDSLMRVMAIDHALVDRRARIQDFRVVSVAGSDHAALITRIVVPASGP